MKLRVCNAEISAASSSGNPIRVNRCRPALVHGLLQVRNFLPGLADRGRLPAAGGEHDQRVEHLLSEAGCGRERGVPTLHGSSQA